MSEAIAGKKIALTGTFSTMKRAEAEAKLTALGAVLSKSVGKDTDMLIHGDKAGSKVDDARRKGIAIRDEAWLQDILAGGDGQSIDQRQLQGPLGDYMDRLDDYVRTLRQDPALKVGYWRNLPASAAHMDKLAKSWGVERFSDDLRNLYQQADGFVLYWVDTRHPEFKDMWRGGLAWDALERPTSPEHPGAKLNALSTRDMETFPYDMGGACWLLPSAEVFKLSGGYFDFAYGVLDEDEETEAYGRTFVGEQLERAIRVFDVASQYYPVGLFMERGQSSPPVLTGDDHGACWTDSRHMTFEDYLESLLHQHFRLAVRGELVMGYNPNAVETQPRLPPIPLESLLRSPS